MTRQPAVVILGAGPAGICAALELGDDALVLERQSEIGGLTCSFEVGGVVFDLGGHTFHTPHPEIRNLVFDAVEMDEQQREARCFVNGSLITYPFQKNFHQLEDRGMVEECEHGLRCAGSGESAANLKRYLYDRFGAGLAKHFLLPYNRKLWGAGLERISTDWVGERIAKPAGESDRFETTGGHRTPLQGGMMVAYPARGGFGEIAKALARRIANLRLGTRVKVIDPRRRTIVTAAGETISWRRLVSTLPLDRVIGCVTGVPDALRARIAGLQRIALKLVCVVIDRPVETSIQRIYSAGSDIAAHKIGIANNSSHSLRALPRQGIFGEVAYAPGDSLDHGRLETRFIENLLELKLLRDRSEIAMATTIDVPYAYPVPTLERSAIVAEAKAWLESRDIHTLGRFGEWAYINSDEAMFRGMTLGRRLAGELK